jgi:NADH-quinone oxidoreductase subunit N
MIAGVFNPSSFNAGLVYAWPEIFLGLAACAILMLDLVLNEAQRRWVGMLSIITLVITAVLVVMQHPPTYRIVALGGMFELDRMAQVLKIATLVIVSAVFV